MRIIKIKTRRVEEKREHRNGVTVIVMMERKNEGRVTAMRSNGDRTEKGSDRNDTNEG